MATPAQRKYQEPPSDTSWMPPTASAMPSKAMTMPNPMEINVEARARFFAVMRVGLA